MTEIEVAFIILSNDQNKVIGTIIDLILSEGYTADQIGSIKINDTYFDKRNNLLEKKRIGLRIRTINEAKPQLTLKISKKDYKEYTERTEIEKPWSQDALNEIVCTLNSHIVVTDTNNLNLRDDDSSSSSNDKYLDSDPKSTLISMGFKVIQNRETYRNIINAVSKKSGRAEYEFAIDTTSYLINGNRITNTELEIELKNSTNNGNPQLTGFIDKLKDHNELFQLWPYSKLVTGKAIESLWVSHKFRKHHDIDNNYMLTRQGIEKIIELVKSTRHK